jgi:hypothetical protein
MGGGTCYNGGWLPPGISPPAGEPPAPPPPPPAAPPSGGCLTPDPFVGIPGLIGLCVNGGWIPVVIGGLQSLLHPSALEGGGWPMPAETGRAFAPVNRLGIATE